MDDGSDQSDVKSRSERVGAVRRAFGQVRDGVQRHGSASLDGLRRSAAEARERLKGSATAERIGEAVETRRVIRKANDARRRGNHPMAFRLLEPEVRDRPDDERLVVAWWHAAIACARERDVAPAVAHLVRHLAGHGQLERASKLWLELRESVPSVRLDPGALVRIAESLEAVGRGDTAAIALRDAVDRPGKRISPGLAARVAELARTLDPPTARVAARRALDSPDLHDAKRARLADLAQAATDETPPGAVTTVGVTAIATNVSPPVDAAVEHAVDEVLEVCAPAARFDGIKVTEAMPTRLQDDAIVVQVTGGRVAHLRWADVQALAVAEVGGLGPYPTVVIDLVLNWAELEDPVLRVLRLRADGFDPRMVVTTDGQKIEGLGDLLAQVLAHEVTPLPDADRILGEPQRFEDLDAYQRAVLSVDEI